MGFLIGFILFYVGGHAWARASGIGERLAWLKEENRRWQVAPQLSGWRPVTTEQLRAVEELADAHDGVAYVRDDGSSTVEVLVRRRFRLHRLWVDRAGNSSLTSVTPARLRPLGRHVRRLESRGETWLEIETAEPPDGE